MHAIRPRDWVNKIVANGAKAACGMVVVGDAFLIWPGYPALAIRKTTCRGCKASLAKRPEPELPEPRRRRK